MYLKCTRVSRIPENGVILLSQIVPFRRIANIVEKKKKNIIFQTWLEMLCQSHTTQNCCISKDLSLDKIARKNAHFEAWLKLSKLKVSFYFIFTLHRKWGNLWKLNAIIMWSFDRRCFFSRYVSSFYRRIFRVLYEK